MAALSDLLTRRKSRTWAECHWNRSHAALGPPSEDESTEKLGVSRPSTMPITRGVHAGRKVNHRSWVFMDLKSAKIGNAEGRNDGTREFIS